MGLPARALCPMSVCLSWEGPIAGGSTLLQASVVVVLYSVRQPAQEVTVQLASVHATGQADLVDVL
jgi:hypothetical protein